MADKNRKTPPGPPGPPHKGPHGPWPSVFPPDGHRPPHPGYPPRWNDTEPVIGVRPWENCCDGESECVCVTSGDVVRWDDISSAVVENSAAWNQGGGDDSWKTSADNWNSTYVTVEENSAFWTSAYQMVENIDSGRLEDLYNLVAQTSSFLESYKGLRYVATKKEEIQGFGTSGSPLQLSEDVRASLRSLNKLIVDLYVNAIIDPQKRKWVSQDQVDELYSWIEDHDKLFWETNPNIEHDGRRPDGVFDQLEKIWKILKSHGGIVYRAGKWISIDHDVISVSGMDPVRWDKVADIVEEKADYWTSAYETASAALEIAEKTEEKIKGIEDVVDNVSAKVEKIDKTLNSVIDDIDSTSGNWNSAYDTVYANSANWDFAYEVISDSATTWNAVTDIVSESGDYWNEAYDLSKQTAETVEGLVETVSDLSESATLWNSAYHIVEDLNSSAELWNSTYETVSITSAELVDAKDVVQENSAYWSSGGREEWVYAKNMDYTNYSAYADQKKIYFNFSN